MTPEAAVAAALTRWGEGAVGVAVSGGGDSTALLVAAAREGGRVGRPVLAATVDHGLRESSRAEAEAVAALCASLGLGHAILAWDGAGTGNLQARAREARRRLLSDWASRVGVSLLLLGHTADDQAETVLLRLARGSGVDGLAGMPEAFGAAGVTWARPFLGIPREALRGFLRAEGVGWAEDPSNEDPRFDRARARAMMAALGDLGLTRGRLLRTAGHMGRARAALAARAAERAGAAREEGGALVLPLAWVEGVGTEETAGRLLALALMWVGGGEHRPPWEALVRMARLVAGGRAATLHGCRVAPEGQWARVVREPRNPGPPPAERFADFASRQAALPPLVPGIPG